MAEKPRLTTEAYKAARQAGADLSEAVLVKRGVAKVERALEASVEDRVLLWTISTEARDRHGDVVMQDGWELGNFDKAGVILWNHDSYLPPIGKPLQTEVVDGSLKSTAKFATRDEHALADTVYQLALGGYIKSASVGFIPIEAEELTCDDEEKDAELWGGYGVKFLRQELLEWSPVSIPANPEALIDAKSNGVDVAPIAGYVRRYLDGESGAGIYVSRQIAERVYEATRDDEPAAYSLPSTITSSSDTIPAEIPIEYSGAVEPQTLNVEPVEDDEERAAQVAVMMADDGDQPTKAQGTRDRIAALQAAIDANMAAMRADALAALDKAEQTLCDLEAAGVTLDADLTARAAIIGDRVAVPTTVATAPEPDTAASEQTLTAHEFAELGAMISAAVRSAVRKAAGRIGD